MNAELHEVMGYRMGELPFAAPPNPQLMRKGITRATHYSTLIRQVAVMAEREGWTGEDKYTAMTFYLLLRNEELETANFDRFMRDPNPVPISPR